MQTDTEKASRPGERVIIVVATVYVHVNVDAWELEYSEDYTGSQVRDDIRERVRDAAAFDLAYLSPHVLSVE